MPACGVSFDGLGGAALRPDDGVDVGAAHCRDHATTGWHRDHARKALRVVRRPQLVGARRPRPPKYGPKAVAALVMCWSVLGMPAGKRLAPMLGELIAVLRRYGELDIDEDTAALLAGCLRPPLTAGCESTCCLMSICPRRYSLPQMPDARVSWFVASFAGAFLGGALRLGPALVMVKVSSSLTSA